MGGNCLNSGSNCRAFNAGTQHENPKLGSWGLLPFPFPQWPPKHKSTTLSRSTASSRISSTLPRTSSVTSTSAASLKSSQAPSAAVPNSTPALRTSIAPKTSVPCTNAAPSSTKASTAVALSSSPKSSASLPNVTSSLKTSSTAGLSSTLSVPLSLTTSTTAIPSSPFQESDPAIPTKLSSIALMSVTGLGGINWPTSASAEAASQATQALGLGPVEPLVRGKPENGNVTSIVVGVIFGVMLLTLPFVYFMYRRRARNQHHRRSIGAIERDNMFRPWKKSEMNLRRKTANMYSLYPDEKRPREVSMPQPAFAPLRPNRSSSLYSGSILNGISQLSPPYRETPETRSIDDRSNYFDRRSMQSEALSDRSSYTSSGYIYSDDPFQAPLIDPQARRPASVVTTTTEWQPPTNYKGKIRFGMGVQKRWTGETVYPKDGMF